MGLSCMPALEREGGSTRKRPLPMADSDHGVTVAGGRAAPPMMHQLMATDDHWELPAISAEGEEWTPPIFVPPRGHGGTGAEWGTAMSTSSGVSGLNVQAPTIGGANPINPSTPADDYLRRQASAASKRLEGARAWEGWGDEVRPPSVPLGGGMESLKRGRGNGDEVVLVHFALPHGQQDPRQGQQHRRSSSSTGGEGGDGHHRGRMDAEGGSVHRPVGVREPIDVAFEAACRATTQLSLEGKVNSHQAKMIL